jgi:hypothetical protein
METALERLEVFASRPMAFWCTNGGRTEKTKRRLLTAVRHTLNPPASDRELALARQMLGVHADQVVDLLTRHNGFTLYQDERSGAAGVQMLPVAEWEGATTAAREWLNELGDDEHDPDRLRFGVAFAHVPDSGNFFMIPTDGPNAGKVFYADHDGWYEEAFANDFHAFVVRVTTDAVNLLNEALGGYTRYVDGKTPIQWMPEEVADPPASRAT